MRLLSTKGRPEGSCETPARSRRCRAAIAAPRCRRPQSSATTWSSSPSSPARRRAAACTPAQIQGPGSSSDTTANLLSCYAFDPAGNALAAQYYLGRFVGTNSSDGKPIYAVVNTITAAGGTIDGPLTFASTASIIDAGAPITFSANTTVTVNSGVTLTYAGSGTISYGSSLNFIYNGPPPQYAPQTVSISGTVSNLAVTAATIIFSATGR